MTDVSASSPAPESTFAPATLGILVGGRATRMGGVAKGLLPTADGEPIVLRSARIFRRVNATPVLLGAAAAYAGTGLTALADESDVAGPLAGLLALLRHASTATVFLIGGDMPFVTETLALRLARLAAAHDAVAAHDGTRFLPLFAAFRGDAVRRRVEEIVGQGAGAPSAVLRELGAARLSLTAEEAAALFDWDTPEDRARAT